MDLRDTVIRLYESADPAHALHALAEAVAPGRCAVWVDAGGAVAAAYPQGADVSPRLSAEALRAAGPAVHPLSPGFPDDAARHPGAHALLLPLRNGAGTGAGAVVLIGAPGDVDAARWAPVADALVHVGRTAERVRALESEPTPCAAARRRARRCTCWGWRPTGRWTRKRCCRWWRGSPARCWARTT